MISSGRRTRSSLPQPLLLRLSTPPSSPSNPTLPASEQEPNRVVVDLASSRTHALPPSSSAQVQQGSTGSKREEGSRLHTGDERRWRRRDGRIWFGSFVETEGSGRVQGDVEREEGLIDRFFGNDMLAIYGSVVEKKTFRWLGGREEKETSERNAEAQRPRPLFS